MHPLKEIMYDLNYTIFIRQSNLKKARGMSSQYLKADKIVYIKLPFEGKFLKAIIKIVINNP